MNLQERIETLIEQAGIKSPEILNILRRFRRTRKIDLVRIDPSFSNMTDAYVHQAIEHLLGLGLLRYAEECEAIDEHFTIRRLKKIANDNDIPLGKSTRKGDLVTIIRKANERLLAAELCQFKFLIMTLAGERVVIEHDQLIIADRNAFISALADRLYRNDFSEIIQLLEMHSTYFNRDFSKDRYDYYVERIHFIRNACPESLNRLLATPGDLEHFQVAACLQYFCEKILPSAAVVRSHEFMPFEILSKYKESEYARITAHIVSNAIIYWQISRYRENEEVKVVLDCTSPCVACQELSMRRLDSGMLPRFPVEGCDSREGCRIKVIPRVLYEEHEGDFDRIYFHLGFNNRGELLTPVFAISVKVSSDLEDIAIEEEEYLSVAKQTEQSMINAKTMPDIDYEFHQVMTYLKCMQLKKKITMHQWLQIKDILLTIDEGNAVLID